MSETARALCLPPPSPDLDPLNHLQLELLRAYRGGQTDERTVRGIHLTINGLSHGLRSESSMGGEGGRGLGRSDCTRASPCLLRGPGGSPPWYSPVHYTGLVFHRQIRANCCLGGSLRLSRTEAGGSASATMTRRVRVGEHWQLWRTGILSRKSLGSRKIELPVRGGSLQWQDSDHSGCQCQWPRWQWQPVLD